jgi:dienelactone hydrolase
MPRAAPQAANDVTIGQVRIPPIDLPGALHVPKLSNALVIFAHGSGSSRLSPRNIAVSQALNRRGIATLLFDLLTPVEEADRSNVFNIPLLAWRLRQAIDWSAENPLVHDHRIGLFGASTGAAAALVAAAGLGDRVAAIVSRGGRPDLAGAALGQVRTPTLLIVGGNDPGVIELNEQALVRLAGPKDLKIVPCASHLFAEPGALEAVIEHAGDWFERFLLAVSSRSKSLEGTGA